MIGELTFDGIAVIVAAMLVGSVMKGLIGVGLPLIAIPVLAGFLGVERAVVIMAVPTLVTNSWMLWEHRSYAGQTRNLTALVLGGIPGVALGVWGLTFLDDRVLALVLAGLIVVYLLVSFARPQLAIPAAISRVASGPVGLVAGVLHGATGISGPLVATYAHGLRLEPRAFVLTVTVQFQVYAAAQVLGLFLAGLYDRGRLLESLLALLPVVVGMPIGMRLSYRLPRRVFERLVMLALALMAGKLVWDALGVS